MAIRYFAALALGVSIITLSSCGEPTQEVVEAPEGIAGLIVENARLVLPAVSGNPAAVYFDLGYEGDKDVELSAVFVDGAENAVMHEYGEEDFKVQMIALDSLALTRGAKLSFKPGDKHVMAMGVSPELIAGGKTEITLIMASGDKTTVSADVVGAGEVR